MHASAHRDTDRRGKKLADLHSDIEHVHKTASSGGDISFMAAPETCRCQTYLQVVLLGSSLWQVPRFFSARVAAPSIFTVLGLETTCLSSTGPQGTSFNPNSCESPATCNRCATPGHVFPHPAAEVAIWIASANPTSRSWIS